LSFISLNSPRITFETCGIKEILTLTSKPGPYQFRYPSYFEDPLPSQQVMFPAVLQIGRTDPASRLRSNAADPLSMQPMATATCHMREPAHTTIPLALAAPVVAAMA